MRSISKTVFICFILCCTFTTFYSCEKALKRVVKEVTEEGVEKSGKKLAKKGLKNTVKYRLPKSNGKWVGEVGNSKWVPDKRYVPPHKTYNNLKNKSWGQIMKENNIDGINFKDGVPDFDNVSKMETKIDYNNIPKEAKKKLLQEKPNRDALHEYFYEKLAKENNMTVQEIKSFKETKNLVPHETIDGRIQLIPREIHDNVVHEGGVALFRNQLN